MITTNKIKPKKTDDSDKKLNVIKSQDVKIPEFDLTPRDFPGVNTQETRKFKSGLIKTGSVKEDIKKLSIKKKPGRKKKAEK